MLPFFIVCHLIGIITQTQSATASRDDIVWNWHELIEEVTFVGGVLDEWQDNRLFGFNRKGGLTGRKRQTKAYQSEDHLESFCKSLDGEHTFFSHT